LEFLKDVKCSTVCIKSYTGGDENSEKKLQLLRKGIAVNYQHHWIVGRVSNNQLIKNISEKYYNFFIFFITINFLLFKINISQYDNSNSYNFVSKN